MDQFRIRTEFSFRQAYGQLGKIVAAGKSLGAKAMAITDPNTFGHVSFHKKCKAEGILPILGIEMKVKRALEEDDMRTAIFYATTTNALSELYGWATIAAENKNAITYDDVASMGDEIAVAIATAVEDDLADAIRGPGFIEVNPMSSVGRRRAIAFTKKHGWMRLLPTSDASYPLAADRKTAELMGISMKPTPQWMLSAKEARFYMPEIPAEAWNSHYILREMCAEVELIKAENIRHPMDLEAACRAAIPERLKHWNDEYEKRLRLELKTIHAKKFEDYFAMLSGMCNHAKQHMLVGPARGSAAGSLVCYLLNITEIDPLEHDLMFERFIDETRYDYPDIDLDFPDEKREIVFEYLRERYGAANVAHIGTVSRLKAKSAIGEVAKRLGIPPWETAEIKDSMIERSGGDARAAMCIADTFDTTDIGKKFIEKYPAMRNCADLEDHAWHSGVHAAGAIVCNKPIRTYCTVNSEGTAQIDKKDAEAINLMKVDVLGLRTLSVIMATGKDPRNAPLNDPKAFEVFNKKRYIGVFQFEGKALQMICDRIGVHEFEDIVSATSLARPGPLHSGGATTFIKRKLGQEQVESIHPIYDNITAKTYGLVLYQEQVMQLLRQVGNMEWADVQTLRRAMSKSLGLEFFEQFYGRFKAGADANNVPEAATRKIWELMIHFGSYGFNRSHAVAYAIISYWCAWLKAHYPLEFACASLQHAKDEEQSIKLLREIVREGQIEYVPFDPVHSQVNWSIHEGKILGGLVGLKGVGEKMAASIVANRAKGKLTPRQQRFLDEPPLMYADLFPTMRMFGEYYSDPIKKGINGKVLTIAEVDNDFEGNAVIIGRMNMRDVRDLNEPALVQMRGGKIFKHNRYFINAEMEDDTDKCICTIGRMDFYGDLGKQILNAPNNSWWLIRGDSVKGKRKVYVKKLRRLA